MSTFVITCGGTGGHLKPGIAVAESLIQRGHKCFLVVSGKRIDHYFTKQHPQLQFIIAPGVGFSLNPVVFIKCCFHLIRSFIFSIKMLRKIRPDYIIGFGGFITVGVAIAGYLLGCQTILHEANRKAGKAIRLLSILCQRIYLPAGVHLKSLPPKTVRHYGFPLRTDIRRVARQVARLKLGLEIEGKLLLVFGGSQGAQILNEWVLDNYEELAKNGVNIYCVTGPGKKKQETKVVRINDKQVVKVYFVPFVDNLPLVMSASDLALSRAGAGSIAELTRCRLPSLLIPFPYAAEDHQTENARFFECQGGCVTIPQDFIFNLKNEVLDLIFNDWMLNQMKTNLARLDAVDALDLIVKDIESLSKDKNIENESILSKVDYEQ